MMRQLVVFVVFVVLGTIAAGCKRTEPPAPPAAPEQVAAPSAKPEPRVTATMPPGWKPLENVEEPPDVILLGAWENPDFKSLIKVKLLALAQYGNDVAKMAMDTATVRILQGFEVKDVESVGKDGLLLTMETTRSDGTIALKSRMLFRPAGSKVLLIMGAWAAEHDQAGTAAFDATVAGLRIE